MGLLLSLKRKAHSSQRLAQLFNPDPRISAVVVDALVWCLADRGLSLDDEIFQRAKNEVEKYPAITVGKFISGIENERFQQQLRGD